MSRIKRLIKPIAKIIFTIFFDKKYLCGRWFEDGYGGYAFCAKSIWQRNILRLGPRFKFPVGLTCTISKEKNISFHVDDLNNFQSPGTYFQNIKGHIYIGRGSYIAPNVGIITTNHDIRDLTNHTEGKDVVIGERCWIGMNSVILPGVILGNNTVVAAGAVVTKSFTEGFVVIGGTPARIIKKLENNIC